MCVTAIRDSHRSRSRLNTTRTAFAERNFYVSNRTFDERPVGHATIITNTTIGTLFNLYIYVIYAKWKSLNEFQYADDIAITYQSTDLEQGGKALTKHLITINKYFSKWRLKPTSCRDKNCVLFI